MRSKRRNPGLVELYVVRSGARSGEPVSEAAFPSKDLAIQFLSALHGLDKDEVSRLRKDLKLELHADIHGADLCAIQMTAMPPDDAARALSGELYLRDAPTLLTPRTLRAKKKESTKKR